MTMALRPRNPWEAADLGAVMLRAWWRPMYAALACVLVPVAAAAHVFIESRFLALVLVWWLKPLYDRVLLHVMASALFGSIPSLRETLAAIPSLVRHTGLVGALTVRRLDPSRSFALPVRQLEQQSGAPARARERLLGRRMIAQTSALLYCCMAFEIIVAVSAAALPALLTPATMATDNAVRAILAAMVDLAVPWRAITNALLIVGFFAIEPLFAAAGFALYLHRRTTLEAWDLELRFRRLQLASPTLSARAALVAAGALCTAAMLLPEPVQAAQSSREVIQEVLAGPEFQQHRTYKLWRRRGEERSDTTLTPKGDDARGRFSLGAPAAELLRLVAYTALAVVLFLALHFLLRQLLNWRAHSVRAADEPVVPEVVFGLDVRPEALPADLAELAARTAASDPRLALSLLYRGALVNLIHRDRLRIAHGDTEADCVRRVQAAKPPAIAAYFERLVAAWSQTAYGHCPVQPSQVSELCAQWPQHFGAAATA